MSTKNDRKWHEKRRVPDTRQPRAWLCKPVQQDALSKSRHAQSRDKSSLPGGSLRRFPSLAARLPGARLATAARSRFCSLTGQRMLPTRDGGLSPFPSPGNEQTPGPGGTQAPILRPTLGERSIEIMVAAFCRLFLSVTQVRPVCDPGATRAPVLQQAADPCAGVRVQQEVWASITRAARSVGSRPRSS
jgi:hypothetical protein